MFLKWHAWGKNNDSHNIYKGKLEANRSLADTHWFSHKLLEPFFQAHADISLVVIIMTHLFCVAYNYYWCVRSGRFSLKGCDILLELLFLAWNDYKSFIFKSDWTISINFALGFFSSNILITCPCFQIKKIRFKMNLFSRKKNMIKFFLENKFIFFFRRINSFRAFRK